jgi:hypothetical protein
MKDEFLSELKLITEKEKQVKQEITKLIDWQFKEISLYGENYLYNEEQIEKLVDDIYIRIEKLEKINRTSLNKISVAEISKRSKLIEEVKSTTRNLSRYFNNTIKKTIYNSNGEKNQIKSRIMNNDFPFNSNKDDESRNISYSELIENKRKGNKMT